MIVSSLENAKLALMQMLITDESSKDFHELMEDFFTFSNQKFIEIKDLSAKSHHVFKLKFASLEKNVLDAQDELNRLNEETMKQNQRTIEATRSKYSQDIATLELTNVKEKNDFEAKLVAFEDNYKLAIKTYQQNYNKTVSLVKKQSEAIKTDHMLHMDQIEFEKLQRIQLVTASFHERVIDIQTKKEALLAQYQERLTALKHVRHLQSKAHDDDYIMIKTHYNLLLKALNVNINELKTLKQKSIQFIQDYYMKQQQPFIDADKADEKKYVDNQKRTKKTFEETTNTIHQTKTEITTAHNNEISKIQTSTSQSVSLLNSKLSNFRELTESKKIDVMRQFHAKTESEKTHDVSTKNQLLRQYDNELNHLIVSVRKKIRQQKIEGQLEIFETNKAYQITLNKLLHELKEAQLMHDFNLRKLDLLRKQYLKAFEDQILQIESKSTFHLELLDSNYNQEILRFETQLSIATESQERDLNQMSQDVFIDITVTDIDIEKLNYAFLIDDLNIDNDLENAKLTHAFELESINQETKRRLERENLIKSLLLEEQTLREHLAKNIESRHIIDDEKKYFLEKTEVLNALEVHEHAYQYHMRTLKADYDFEMSKMELSTIEHNTKQSLRYDLTTSLHHDKLHALRMEEQYEIIKHTLNESFNRQLLLGKLKQYIFTLYNKPAHPELIRQYLSFVNDYMTETKSLEYNAFLVCKQRVIEYNQFHVQDVSKNARLEAIKHIDVEHFHARKRIDVLENTLNQNMYDIEQTIKQQKHPHSKDDTAYEKLKKEKLTFEKMIASLEKSREKKIVSLDKKLSLELKTASSFTLKLEKLFTNLVQTSQTFYEQQLQSISLIQNELYITESILDQHLKTSFKHDDVYHQKLVSISQQLFNILLDQYHLALKLEKQEKTKRELAFNASLLVLKKKHDENTLQLNHLKSSYKHDLDSISKTHKAMTAEAVKLQQKATFEQSEQLTKSISKDEETLQDFTANYQKTLDYFDLNSQALKDNHKKQHDLNVVQLHTTYQDRLQVIRNNHESIHEQLSSKIKSTELNIEHRLQKYRLKVSKFKLNLQTKEQHLLSERASLKKLHQQKMLLNKQKTKSLLSKHEKDVSSFESLRQKAKTKLQHVSNQRQKHMIKTVSRGHRFKSKMLNLS